MSLTDIEEPTEGPSNEALRSKIEEIIAEADLDSVTARNIRANLSDFFGVCVVTCWVTMFLIV